MSGTDKARFDSNERVDLEDMQSSTGGQLTQAFEQLGGQFLTDPSKQRAFVVEGFEIDNFDGAPLGGVQVRVKRGRAILSRIDEGTVTHGTLTTQGDTQKIIDISSFSVDTYGVFIRFQVVEGDNEGRSFWDSTAGEEISQTIATSFKANWSMRIELTNPGSEWHKIAEVTVAAGVVFGLVDMREFYFEGDVDNTYSSQWSTDSDPDSTVNELATVSLTTDPTWPGGSGPVAIVATADTSEGNVNDFIRADTDGRWYKIISVTASTNFIVRDVHAHGGTFPTGALDSSLQTDRGSDRQNDGVFDLQSFSAATRQCLEDIKGRGLRRWWDRDIGGLNVGFDGDPVEARIAFGADTVYLDYGAGNTPALQWFTGHHILMDLLTPVMEFQVNSVDSFELFEQGGRFAGGLDVGFASTPTADQVRVGDADFGLDFSGANPVVRGSTTMDIEFDRTGSETMSFKIDGSVVAAFEGATPQFNIDIEIDHDVNVSGAAMDINNANTSGYALDLTGVGANPTLQTTNTNISGQSIRGLANSNVAAATFQNIGGGYSTIFTTVGTTRGTILLSPVLVHPSSPEAGSLHVHNDSGLLTYSRSTSTGVQNFRHISPVLHAEYMTSDSLNVTTETAFATFATIPQDTVDRLQMNLRVLATFQAAGGVAQTYTFHVYLGDRTNIGASSEIGSFFLTSSTASFYAAMDLNLCVTTIGGAGTIQGLNTSHAQEVAGGLPLVAAKIVPISSGSSINWGADLQVFATMETGTSLDLVNHHQLVVELH